MCNSEPGLHISQTKTVGLRNAGARPTQSSNGHGSRLHSHIPQHQRPSAPTPSRGKCRRGAQRKADSTQRSSQAVPHPSTNWALRRLTSEVGRDPVHSTRYGRQRQHSRRALTAPRATSRGQKRGRHPGIYDPPLISLAMQIVSRSNESWLDMQWHGFHSSAGQSVRLLTSRSGVRASLGASSWR